MKLFLLITIFLTSSVYAAPRTGSTRIKATGPKRPSDLKLENYCKFAKEELKLSELASRNNGKISIKYRKRGRLKKKLKLYKGCRYDTPWISKMYSTICHSDGSVRTNITSEIIDSLDYPSAILFFFDGAGDFNAGQAKYSLNPVNLDGSEGIELFMGNANGLRALREMYTTSSHPLNTYKREIELHYHSSAGFGTRENYGSAVSCAHDTKYYLDVLKNNRNGQVQTKWMGMGYSNGGSNIIDFQNDLEGKISFDLIFSIDPVVQTIFYPFHSIKEYLGSRSKSTKRLVNIYQQEDTASLPPLDLRGKPVEGADINLQVSGLGSWGHIYILGSKAVLKTSSCEISKVFEVKGNCDE